MTRGSVEGAHPPTADQTIDASLPPADVRTFERIHAARLAARAIARNEWLGVGRYAALSQLVQSVRRDAGSDEWLRVTVQRVIYEEARELLVDGITPTAPASNWAGDPVTAACRALVLEHRDRCQTCLRLLPDLDALARWAEMDRAAWHAAFVREQASEREAAATEGAAA
jgi:hypothetical protein